MLHTQLCVQLFMSHNIYELCPHPKRLITLFLVSLALPISSLVALIMRGYSVYSETIIHIPEIN